MFCSHCGHEKDKNANFCKNCGGNVSENKSSASTSQQPQQPLTFKDYLERNMSLPARLRGSCSAESARFPVETDMFKNIKKRKKDERLNQIKKDKRDETVKINIGIIELDGGRLKIKRSSLLPVDVRKSDTFNLVKNAGVNKQLAHNKQLRDLEETEWLLLYPDMDIVNNIPGSTEKFTVEKYKHELGRPYSRLNLYICTMTHFEVANDLVDDAGEETVVEDYCVEENPIQSELVQANPEETNAIHADPGQASCIEGESIEADPFEIDPFEIDPFHNNHEEVDFLPIEDFQTGPVQAQVEVVSGDEFDLPLEETEPEADVIVQPAQVPLLEDNFQGLDLVIHRTTLLKDMITAFSVPSILKTTIFFKVVDDRGVLEQGEGRGVAREMFTEFWHLFYQSLSVGASTKVPTIRHDYQKQEWKAVARILLYGYCKEGVYPIALSAAFVACTVLGEDRISSDILVESFMAYIADDEREVVDNCLKNRSQVAGNEDLLDILGSYKCFRIPKEENIEDILSQLAHQELIQRPRYVSHCWAPILQSLKSRPQFEDMASILHFYDESKPTAKRVVKILEASPENQAQRNTFDHLVRYIKSLGGNVSAFLQFATGSNIIVEGQKLKVTFTELNGLQRRPVAHTCGPLLELPCTYQYYNELVEEFSSILKEKSAWSFDFV